MIKIGSNSVNAIYLGLSAVDRLYYNGEMIWPDSGFTYFVLTDGSVVKRPVKGQLLSTDVPDGVVSAQVGDDVTVIGTRSFINQNTLSSIAIPDNVQLIGSSAFENCGSLTSIEIPDGVTAIYGSTFKGCSSLVSASIPDTVTIIQSTVFYECRSLSSIDIPDNLSVIDEFVFKRTGLLSAGLPGSVTNIKYQAFCECLDLSAVDIPTSVSAISERAFARCTSLVSVDLPGVKILGPYVFSNCSSLTAAEFSDELTQIGYGAFEMCGKLSSVEIPDSVASIGYQAFKDCNSLAVFNFGNTRTTVPELGNINAFQNVYSNYAIIVPDALYDTWIGATNWSDDGVRPHIVRWSEYFSLRFTAVDPGATITFNKYGTPAEAEIMTSLDAKTWQPYVFGTTITLPNAGDTVYFRAKDENNISFYTDTYNRYWFQTSGADKKIAAAGNIQSLMKAYNKPLDISDKVYCYRGLFQTNKGLVATPDLPAMALANSCYENMFQLCPALSSAPALPATALANRCYANMFYNCTALSSAPALSCEQPATACYQNMFGSCSSLTAVPDIPFKKANKWTYQQTFQNCTSISGTVTIKLDPISEIPANSFVYTFETPPDQTPLSVVMDFSGFTAIPLLANYGTIDVFNNSSDPRLTIKVPASLLTTWKESSNWSNFADRIIAST